MSRVGWTTRFCPTWKSWGSMAFSEFETARFRKLCLDWWDVRDPPGTDGRVDLAVAIRGQALELAEHRPHWEKASEWIDVPFAKLTWNATAQQWQLYWMRGNLKWNAHPVHPTANTVEEALAIIGKDEDACFFGCS